jgi:hypothetical protein
VKNHCPESKAAGEVLTAKQAPHRPGTAPALGLRAGNGVISILPQTEGDFTVGLRKQSLLRVEQLEDRCLLSGDVVLHWNELLVQSLPFQPPRVPLARNMALVHVAMFDAVNAIDRSYEPYAGHVHASHGASLEAAAAQAAHDTLTALYPSRQAVYDAALAEDLAGIPPGRARQGIAVGQEVARQSLDLRADDGSSAIVTYTPPNTDPGQWQPTPPDFSPAANAHVPLITPFAVASTSQFRPGPPPALTSPEYAAAFNEVKALGSVNSTVRTADQTQVGLLWRLPLTNQQVWNRIAQDVAEARGLSLPENARLFALLDMAMNDGLETSFGAKYYYTLWRPVSAIRRAAEDGNPATEADPAWTTLHPTTPSYPTYSGNAATIGAASATVLAGVLGSNDVPFEVHWDSYGFPGVTRSYAGFWAAADEEARSRVYGGIHFSFDNAAGQQIGANVAHYVMDHFLLPRDGGDDQLRAVAAAPAPVNDSLRAGQVQPLRAEALARWQAAGVDPSALHGIDVRIADTLLEHEAGHRLGRDHEADGVMQEALDAGIRRTIGPTNVTDTDGIGDAQTLFAWNANTPWIEHGFVSHQGKRG